MGADEGRGADGEECGGSNIVPASPERGTRLSGRGKPEMMPQCGPATGIVNSDDYYSRSEE